MNDPQAHAPAPAAAQPSGSVAEVVDDLILGAGCVGLSLAVAMVRAGITRRRIVVVDPRPDLGGDDRAWSGWCVTDHGFAGAVRHRWLSWRLRAGGRVIDRTCAGHAYERISAEAFHREAAAVFATHRNVELRLGVRAGEITTPGEWVRVDTDAGPLRARRVFDGRPPALAPPRGPHGNWVRHAGGAFVRTAEPVFEPGRLTLMDLDVPQPRGGLHFVRVLPFRRDRALVESAYLSPEPLARERYDATVAAYLRERLGATYTITDRVYDAVPLADAPLRPAPRVYRIGLGGAPMRPTTGRDFGAVQRFAAALAARLAAADLPEPPPHGRVGAALDRVFLSYLERQPERGPALFAALFERVEPASLVRFLAGCADPSDTLRVLGALPKLALTAEAARVYRPRRQ